MWSFFAVLFSTWDKKITKYATEKKRAQRKESLLVSSLTCLVKTCFKMSECCTILYKKQSSAFKAAGTFSKRSVCPPNSLLPWWAVVSVTFGHR